MGLRGRTRDTAPGRHVLVTGAASGMGRAVARQLGAAGARLYLTDLDEAGLTATATAVRDAGGEVVVAQVADVSSAEDVAGLATSVHAEVDAVDIVMNVAGIAVWGKVENLTVEHWRRVVEVNLMGPIHVIQEFVPPMIAAGRRGNLVNVSSAAGLIGLPWHAPYSATKFGLRGISEVLRFDLKRHGIAVTLVCPGAVDTEISGSVVLAGVDTSGDGFQAFRRRFQRNAVSPEVAAERIIAGTLARRPLVFTSPDTRAVHALQRHAPWAYGLAMDRVNRAADRASREWS